MKTFWFSDIEPFLPSDNNAAGFDKYIRNFEINARAAKITNQQALKDNLLGRGGKFLQETYFLLPDSVEKPEEVEQNQKGTAYDDCVKLLKVYFKKQTSKTYEKYLLRQIKQGSGEEFQDFLKRIRTQVQTCDFKDQARIDEEILDQIVFGTSSEKLRAELLKDDVTLSVAIAKARQFEGVASQLKAFQATDSGIYRIKSDRSNVKSQVGKCYDCGYAGHFRGNPSCPAKNQICKGCGMNGHFIARCPTKNKRGREDDRSHQRSVKRIRYVQTEDDQDRNYVFMLRNDKSGDKEPKVQILVNGIQVTAIIDSGCPVTIVNGATYGYLIGKGLIENDYKRGCDISFYGYETNRPAIEITGSVKVNLQYEDQEVSERIYIAPYGRENLLGKQTAEILKLLQVGPNVLNVNVTKEFPKIKNCLVNVTINRDIAPTVVKYRRLPLEVEDKIHDEVHKLLDLGIIEPVPTDEITWVSRMIPIQKTPGEYRLVVDMRLPNLAVSPEYYPQPSVEEVLMLPSVRKLSKIDLQKGFHLCELDPKCRDITGFATKEGVFRYKRLMFGLKSAPELFNKEIDKIFMNHKGIRKYCDDFLVYGATEREHDENLEAVLRTIEESNLKINQDKSVFNVTKLKFLGHVVTTKGILPDPDKVKDIRSFREPKNKEEAQSLLGKRYKF